MDSKILLFFSAFIVALAFSVANGMVTDEQLASEYSTGGLATKRGLASDDEVNLHSGDAKVKIDDNQVEVSAGDTSVKIDDDSVEIKAGNHSINIEGDKVHVN